MIISSVLPKKITEPIILIFSQCGPYDPKYNNDKIPLLETDKEIVSLRLLRELNDAIKNNINVYILNDNIVDIDNLELIEKEKVKLYYNNALENLNQFKNINTGYVTYSYNKYNVKVLKNKNQYILKLNINDSKFFKKDILNKEYIYINDIGWIECEYFKNKKNVLLVFDKGNILLNDSVDIIHGVKTVLVDYYKMINDIEKYNNIQKLMYFKNSNINSSIIPVNIEIKNEKIIIYLNTFIEVNNIKNINFINIQNNNIITKTIYQYKIINNRPCIVINNDIDINHIKNSIIQLGEYITDKNDEKIIFDTHKNIIDTILKAKIYFIKEKENITNEERKYIGNLVLQSLDVILMSDNKEIPLIINGKPYNNIEVTYILHTDNTKYRYGDVEVIIKPIEKYITIPIISFNDYNNSIIIKANIEKDDDEYYIDINENINLYTVLNINDNITIINNKKEVISNTKVRKIDNNVIFISLTNNEKEILKSSKNLFILIKKYLLSYNKSYKLYIKAYDKLEEMLYLK